MIRPLTLLLLVASCSNQQHSHRTVNSRSGLIFWEYEATAGIPDGRTRTYYPNGEVQTDGYYLHGQKHGLHHAYADTGEIIKKAFFWYDVLVWSTLSATEAPPRALVLSLAGLTDPVEIRRLYGGAITVREETFRGLDLRPPEALFVSADRHVARGDRIGLLLGAGGATGQFSSARRYSMFGKLTRGKFGAFFQVDGSNLANLSESWSGTIEGRRTLEFGGTHGFPSTFGHLTARVSFVAPVGHDDADGYLAAAATSFQRPTDAIYSLPSTVAVRSSMSWILRGARWVIQMDAGLDAAVAGVSEMAPVFGRFNAAFGLGVRSAIASLEVSNAAPLDAFDRRLQSLGVGAAFFSSGIVLKMLAARTTGGHATLSLGSEYVF